MSDADNALKSAIETIKREYDCLDKESGADTDGVGSSLEVSEKVELANKIINKFQSTFDAPPIAEIEFLINKPCTASEVRFILFCPLPDQIQYYVTILNVTNYVHNAVDFIKVRNFLLSMVFLIHR